MRSLTQRSFHSAVTARRLDTLREFFHFLQFGENGNDFPLLPEESVESGDSKMDLLLAKYDLDTWYVATLVYFVVLPIYSSLLS